MKLSVCLIARDEERNLPRALRSVRDLADEIVVTDTGSTDRTMEIATAAGATVHRFAWCDDFSAAYNACIDRATGDWILLLDADEELMTESHAEVLRSIAHKDALVYSVLRRDLVDEGAPGQYTAMLHLRLFRNRSDFRFVGRIHHHLIPCLPPEAGGQSQPVRRSLVELNHYGYATGDTQAKLMRAARLMELELRDRPGQFYYQVELGRSWLALQDPRGEDLLATAARRVQQQDPAALQPGGALAMLLEQVLAADVLPRGFPLSHRDASALAEDYFPDSIPLIWQRARRVFKNAQFELCSRLLERILELGTTHRYDMHVSFDPEIMSGRARLNLGVCYVELNRERDARWCFQSLLDSPHYGAQARANLEKLERANVER